MPPDPAQTLRERLPAPALRGEVICVWEQRVAAGAPAYRFRSVPDGATEIVCALGSAPLVCGPRTGPGESTVAPGEVVVGLRLRPGAAAAVLHLDAAELVDAEIGAAAVLGDRAARRLERCETSAELADELQATIAARAVRLDPLAAHAIHRLARGDSVTTLARELAISERQLHRRCVRAGGIAPKPLARTLRYQRFLALAGRAGQPTGQLARLAADAGYADQAHLTREAHRLAGATPAQVLRDAAAECTGNHDHAASQQTWLAV